MSIDENALSGLRSTLEADDYRMDVTESGSGVEVTITVTITGGPDACADCLVPKPIMRNILHAALGVPEDAIELVYPADSPGADSPGADSPGADSPGADSPGAS